VHCGQRFWWGRGWEGQGYTRATDAKRTGGAQHPPGQGHAAAGRCDPPPPPCPVLGQPTAPPPARPLRGFLPAYAQTAGRSRLQWGWGAGAGGGGGEVVGHLSFRHTPNSQQFPFPLMARVHPTWPRRWPLLHNRDHFIHRLQHSGHCLLCQHQRRSQLPAARPHDVLQCKRRRSRPKDVRGGA
jgi:hypothetical protein